VFGGANDGWITDTSGDPFVEPRWRRTLGAVVDVDLRPQLSLSLELSDARKGAHLQWRSTYILRLDCLEMAALLKASGRDGRLKPYLKIGPSVGILRDATIASRWEGNETVTSMKDRFKGPDIGIVVGAGAVLPRGAFEISLEGRYAYGLRDLWDGDHDLLGVIDPPNRTAGWQILAGVLYRIGD